MSTNSTKTIKGRIQNKHGTEEHWLKSVFEQDGSGNITDNPLETPFVPLNGELIIYDPDDSYDYFRFKFGDGDSNVYELPFVGEAERSALEESIKNLELAGEALEEKIDQVKLDGETERKELSDRIDSLELGGGAVQSDYDENDPTRMSYIKNRPFWYFDGNITINTNNDKLSEINFSVVKNWDGLVIQVSKDQPENLIGASGEYYNNSAYSSSYMITEDNLYDNSDYGTTYKLGENTYIIIVRDLSYSPSFSGTTDKISFSDKGIYFTSCDTGDPNEVRSLTYRARQLKKLDNKFLDIFVEKEQIEYSCETKNIRVPIEVWAQWRPFIDYTSGYFGLATENLYTLEVIENSIVEYIFTDRSSGSAVVSYERKQLTNLKQEISGGYIFDRYLLFINNFTEFQNSYGITLPSNGLYLADCEWDLAIFASNNISVTKLLINEQRKIDSKYLDLDTSELSEVAFSGDYNDLINKPDIIYPVTSVAGKTGTVTLAKEDVGLGNVENKSSATIRGELTKANVTTALGYTPPTQDTTYSEATISTAGLMSAADKTKLNGIASGAEVNVQSDWNETATTSDAYIKNKPTIPTVNDGKLTIQKNGTTVQTFTANQSGDIIANIVVPTKVSELTNDSGFKTVDTNTTYDLSAPKSESNGNVTIDLTAGGSGSGTDSVKISGAGSTTVTTNEKGDIVITSTYEDTTYDVATTATLGLVKSSTTGTTANRNYAVEVNSDGTMKVNVPWVNTQDGNDNQTVKAGTVTFGANDPIDFVAGNNVTVTGNKTEKKITIGLTNVATLDENGHVPSTQLPSYVDDVIEGYISNNKNTFYSDEAKTKTIPAETGKIYLDIPSLKTYRWGGSTYAEISESLALGETATTAYYGDKGKVAYDHSQSSHAPSDAEKNVQSDWNETNTNSDAYIKNKPTIPIVNDGTLTLKASDGATATEKTFTANDTDNVTFEVKHAVPTGASATSYGPSAGGTQTAKGTLDIIVPQITTDKFGHITGVSNKTFKVTDTDTIYTHPNSGVTAGTYESVTVNAQGHVTAGTNPTKYWANVAVSGSSNDNTSPTFNPGFKVKVATNNDLNPAADWAWASPIAKYLWHDLLAFRAAKFESSTDGSTWTQNTAENYTKMVTNQKESQALTIIDDSKPYCRFTWLPSTTSQTWHACQAQWLVIGFTWVSSAATCTIKFQTTTDGGSTWTDACSVSVAGNSTPHWIKLDSSKWSNCYGVRLIFTRTSSAGSTAISSVKWLTPRWGNQGFGSEAEFPYEWNNNQDIYPRAAKASNLGSSSKEWANVYTNNLSVATINGVTVGSSPKFTDNNNNQTIKGNGTAFGIDDAVNIVGGGDVSVAANATNKTITISYSTPSNNVTGSGTSGKLVKWSDSNTVTDGPEFGTDTAKFLNNKGEWATAVTKVEAGTGLTGGPITTSGTISLDVAATKKALGLGSAAYEAASVFQTADADLTAIAGLTGTSGFLKKTAANTWSLDTNTYLTSEKDTLQTVTNRGASTTLAISTGGLTINNGNMVLHSDEGNSPKLIFERGDNTGTLTDWNIQVVQGALNFNTVYNSNSTAETLIMKLDYSGNLYATTLYENNTALSSKYLGISATAADSSKLGGVASTGYIKTPTASSTTTFSLIGVDKTTHGNTAYYSDNTYVESSTGKLVATSFGIATNATIKYESSDESIRFVFS